MKKFVYFVFYIIMTTDDNYTSVSYGQAEVSQSSPISHISELQSFEKELEKHPDFSNSNTKIYIQNFQLLRTEDKDLSKKTHN